ncbi:MAG: UDP-N-acetylmuramoyl-tripeptide--D-alanyl-D-alanine ligase [Pseudomonadota bacterium]|nr:UDP-N-acetylmuramoyl-tripeptide--D-alanyl-D-alanine ligase [Pseudomonadota bacterium]
MIDFSVSEAASILSGEAVNGDARFNAVSTDSRTLDGEALFVAIPGENFDGHDYVEMAASQGAVAALVDRKIDIGIPQIIVADVRIALLQLAAAWRSKSHAVVIALTGSNGKTTVKEMLAAILSQQGSVLATIGNLNNEIGVPLTLTRLQNEEYAVIEMGANHLHEIHQLSVTASPDVALLNNAGRAHLEGFGSIEGVARAKGEIIDGLSDDGIFVCNGESQWLPLWRELAGDHQVITFGQLQSCDVRLEKNSSRTRWSESGFEQQFEVHIGARQLSLQLPLAGEHNRMNALAAVAVCAALQIDHSLIHDGLKSIRPVPGRLFPRRNAAGLRIIDDTYNANPDSVAAAIALLENFSARTVLVLGDLAELGGDVEAIHAELGRVAAASGIDRLYTLGPMSAAAAAAFGSNGFAFDDIDVLNNALQLQLDDQHVVLIKGSRAARMERVVEALTANEDIGC